jgi:formaldehyde-activating enzyme involved in methanogenesis
MPKNEDSPALVTVVLRVPRPLMERLEMFAYSKESAKFLIVTAMQDYVSKREARIRRANRERAEGKE